MTPSQFRTKDGGELSLKFNLSHDVVVEPDSPSPGGALERQQYVEHLLAVTRLLHIGYLAAAAVSNAGLRDLR